MSHTIGRAGGTAHRRANGNIISIKSPSHVLKARIEGGLAVAVVLADVRLVTESIASAGQVRILTGNVLAARDTNEPALAHIAIADTVRRVTIVEAKLHSANSVVARLQSVFLVGTVAIVIAVDCM